MSITKLYHSAFIVVLLFAGWVHSQPAVGVDNAGTITSTVSATSAVLCAQKCDNQAGCAGWSWDSCGQVNCYLKSAIGTRSANSCRVSDVRLGDVGYDRTGYDMPHAPVSLPGGTASTCAYECVSTTGCVAWSWESTNSFCYLKWWAPARSVSSGVVSGVQGTGSLDWPTPPNLQSTTLPNNASATDCANLCESTSTCYVWIFQVASAACPTATNICWTKAYSSGQGVVSSCRTAGQASRFYNTSVAGPAVSITSVTPVGNQSDPHLAPIYPDRDGGAVGTLGGKIFWVWSDTSYNNRSSPKDNLVAFYGNSGAVGSPSNSTLMTGPKRQAIPFSSQEAAFNTLYSNNPRVVLWPKSCIIETSPGEGVLFCPKGYWGNTTLSGAPNQGIELSTVTVGSDGYANITRLSDVPFFSSSLPAYGGVAAARDQDYIYLYSGNSIAQYTATHFVARAPLTSVSSISTWQYWHDSTKVWSATVPLKNATKDAIFTSTFGIDGNVYYSSYHRAWILIYQNDANYNISMKTAPAPQGPWTNVGVIYSPPPSPSVNYVYGTTGTNLYDLTGKTSSVDFTWCYSGGYANWVVQVNFA